jgi:hypothetical protein
MSILVALRGLLVLGEAILAVPVLYITLLAAAALWATARAKRTSAAAALPAPSAAHLPSFAVLIPAHNEEALLGYLLASLALQTYPRKRYSIIVVADNCDDRTTEVARAAGGTRVYQRLAPRERGKGQALRWIFERLEAEHQRFDAYIILDADSVVGPTFLEEMARGIVGGAQALQGWYTVLNGREAPSAALRWLAITLRGHVRSYGRFTLGSSATLLGNGMCFTRALVERFPWRASALSEDYQYYLTIVQHGVRVEYLPLAVVRSHMPPTFRELRTQDIRWESRQPGHDEWRVAGRLLRDGVRLRSFVRLEAALELRTPPLSPLVCSCLATVVAAIALGWAPALVIGMTLCACLLAYVATGVYLVGDLHAVGRALLHAPYFVIWKLWVVLVLRQSKAHTSAWIRTSRPSLPDARVAGNAGVSRGGRDA